MIAKRLKSARRDAGITQADLAAMLDVSQPTVNRWEGGDSEPARAQIVALAKVLNATPEWLAFGRGSRAPGRTGKGAPPRPEQPRPEADRYRQGRFGQGDTTMTDGTGKVIAFQGQPGAYSNLACREVYPDYETLPCDSFEDAFAAVSEGTASLAMIPIENSLGGRVADIHLLLPQANLFIVGEHFQPVHHQLLAVPGATLEQIKQVRSHPQGLAQCRETLRELKLEPVPRADTAGSAREVAEMGDPTVAAIASELAGEIYGLETLRSRVEDRIGNTTRFIFMSRRRIEPDPADGPAMTSIVFQVRSVPAALYKALGGFATNGINIVKLESYITDSGFTRAQFYAEIDGHPADKPVDLALEELQYFSSMVKMLGVYPANRFRTNR